MYVAVEGQGGAVRMCSQAGRSSSRKGRSSRSCLVTGRRSRISCGRAASGTGAETLCSEG